MDATLVKAPTINAILFTKASGPSPLATFFAFYAAQCGWVETVFYATQLR